MTPVPEGRTGRESGPPPGSDRAIPLGSRWCDVCGSPVREQVTVCAVCGEKPLFILARESGWEYIGVAPAPEGRATGPDPGPSAMTSKCPACGGLLRQTAVVCHLCGTKLR
jgi:predicted amidophosphoribosyltransferase